jgi:hypothetical protein
MRCAKASDLARRTHQMHEPMQTFDLLKMCSKNPVVSRHIVSIMVYRHNMRAHMHHSFTLP